MVYFCHVVSEEQIFKSIFAKHVKKGLICIYKNAQITSCKKKNEQNKIKH
jgi:hypothetical protein